MAITVEALRQRLQAQLNPSFLDVLDESAAHAGHAGVEHSDGHGTHFRIRIQSPAFIDKSRVMRHRLVYDALSEYMDQGIHALAIEIIETP